MDLAPLYSSPPLHGSTQIVKQSTLVVKASKTESPASKSESESGGEKGEGEEPYEEYEMEIEQPYGKVDDAGELTEKEIIRAERNSGVISDKVREIQLQNAIKKKEQKELRTIDLREGLKLYKLEISLVGDGRGVTVCGKTGWRLGEGKVRRRRRRGRGRRGG